MLHPNCWSVSGGLLHACWGITFRYGERVLYTFRVRAKVDCIVIFPCGMFIAKTCANHFDTCICRQHAHACKNKRTCAVCPSTLIVIQHPTVSLRCPSHRLQNPLISARAGDPRLTRGSTACKTCGKSRFRRPAVEKWFIKVLKGEIDWDSGWQHAWKYGRTEWGFCKVKFTRRRRHGD
jgi:hypothetical protein